MPASGHHHQADNQRAVSYALMAPSRGHAVEGVPIASFAPAITEVRPIETAALPAALVMTPAHIAVIEAAVRLKRSGEWPRRASYRIRLERGALR